MKKAPVKDLTIWLRQGRDHAYAGILRGVFLPEGMVDLREEVVLVEDRTEEMWTSVVCKVWICEREV